jgi:hypothetical protein
MNCLDYQDLLSEYLDGDLKENKRVMVSEHLKACQECNLVYKELKQIVNVSQQLPLLSPENKIWQKIEKDIKEITASQPTTPKSLWSRFWNYRLEFSLSVPQITGTLATLAILLLFASTFSYVPQNINLGSFSQNTVMAQVPIVNTTEMELESTIDRLSHSTTERYQDWDPEIQKLFDRNIKIVDKSIEESRLLEKRNPNDPVVHELIITAYQEKIRLLEQFLSLK